MLNSNEGVCLVYVDDSVHDQAGFVIAACVFSETDFQDPIKKVIHECGFNSHDFEFKSGSSFARNPNLSKVRDQYYQLLAKDCKLGVVIVPRTERYALGMECIKAIVAFVELNQLGSKYNRIQIFMDEGMFTNKADAERSIEALMLPKIEFHIEQDSVKIRGLQLADLSAHNASIQFKSALGLIQKQVRAGENSGYDPDEMIDLGFEMWARMRYNLFNEGFSNYDGCPPPDNILLVEPYGLYISSLCNEELSSSARACFGTVYLGCIH